MEISVTHHQKQFKVNLKKGIDISSRYGLKDLEPKAWNTPDVSIIPFEDENWVAEVKQGSAVNFFNIAFNPHGNGTHTESIGHIEEEQISISKVLNEFHFMARLVHLESTQVKEDRVITKADFLLKNIALDVTALILNIDHFIPDHNFSNSNPPYFEAELLAYLAENGVNHFITNLPSVDRELDAGALAGHKAFWNFNGVQRKENTITELVHVPASVAEGLYFLNLQVAPFHNDAAPSRLMLYSLQEH